jgi:hypothetical protein
MNFVAITSSLRPHGAKAFAGLTNHPAIVRELQWAGDDAAPPTNQRVEALVRKQLNYLRPVNGKRIVISGI